MRDLTREFKGATPPKQPVILTRARPMGLKKI
jgi:hypothetical protein